MPTPDDEARKKRMMAHKQAQEARNRPAASRPPSRPAPSRVDRFSLSPREAMNTALEQMGFEGGAGKPVASVPPVAETPPLVDPGVISGLQRTYPPPADALAAQQANATLAASAPAALPPPPPIMDPVEAAQQVADPRVVPTAHAPAPAPTIAAQPIQQQYADLRAVPAQPAGGAPFSQVSQVPQGSPPITIDPRARAINSLAAFAQSRQRPQLGRPFQQ